MVVKPEEIKVGMVVKGKNVYTSSVRRLPAAHLLVERIFTSYCWTRVVGLRVNAKGELDKRISKSDDNRYHRASVLIEDVIAIVKEAV